MPTEDHIRKIILDLIGKIAPEADLDHLDPADRFRNQFDFDSVDFVNFAAALQAQLNTKIPEQDYPQLSTLKSAIAYVKSKTGP